MTEKKKAYNLAVVNAAALVSNADLTQLYGDEIFHTVDEIALTTAQNKVVQAILKLKK